MKLILTEKPSVAREIGKVLGITNKHDGFLNNNEYYLTWAFGHLIELAPPDVYGWGKWSTETLPMIPEKFITRPSHKFDVKAKEWYIDEGIKKQLNTIKVLLNVSTEIIVATDAGREGELIFRYIYQFLDCNLPFKRLWISSLTDKAIEKGFKELVPGNKFDNLFDAAKCRSEADWLVGMNASRSLTIVANNQTGYSLGRVQTPTLAMICSRFIENKNFVPVTYFVVKIYLFKDNIEFTSITEALKEKTAAETIIAKIKDGKTASIKEVATKEKVENAPLLYDLTTLQQDANKAYGLSADDTLKAAQNLYESKFLTYPRTGSRYISEDVLEEIPTLLKTIVDEDLKPIVNNTLKIGLNKRSVNGNKVTDHHAILITENSPSNLTETNLKVYLLVLYRVLESFSTPCIKDITNVIFDCAGIPFKSNGTVIKQLGWREVKRVKKTVIEEEEENTQLPALALGEEVAKTKESVETKQTKPKPIHTEASLLEAMETCGKHIEDETLKEALKDIGIGTPATRASVIETLLHRGYIERQKKQLVPLEKGLNVYHLVKDKPFASAELTGNWEKRLEAINRGNEIAAEFMDDIIAYTKTLTSDLLKNEVSFVTPAPKQRKNCPKCKKGVLVNGNSSIFCSEYKNGCDIKIWKTVAGKTITEKQIEDLITKNRTGLIKGFKSKAGKSFNAALEMKTDFSIGFIFT